MVITSGSIGSVKVRSINKHLSGGGSAYVLGFNKNVRISRIRIRKIGPLSRHVQVRLLNTGKWTLLGARSISLVGGEYGPDSGRAVAQGEAEMDEVARATSAMLDSARVAE